jgi:predicted permease
MDVAARIAESLLPLALLVGLGAALLKFGFVDQAFRRQLDRLVYWVALPALIVQLLAEAPAEVTGAGRMLLALVAATLGALLLAAAASRLLRRPRAEFGVLTQAAFRGNLAFVGLPVIILATGQDSGVVARAVLIFAPIVLLYNVLGVAGLVAAQHRFDAALPRKMAVSMLTNPLLLACGLGLILWWTRAPISQVGQTTLGLIGQTAAPLALISLGGALVNYPVGRHLPMALLAAGLKCVALPLLAWLACGVLGVTGGERQAVLIFAACPTAVASFVLATQLKGDPALASASIVVSTLAAGPALAVVLALTD